MDMEEATLSEVILFLTVVKSKLIQISGGEPTLHPRFQHFITRVAKTFKSTLVLIESNGSFIDDPARKSQMLKVLMLPNVALQIRTHPQYYPNYERTINNFDLRMLPKTKIFTDCIRIFPIGRAAGMQPEIMYSSCVNTYLLALQRPRHTITQMIPVLQEHKRFCSPMIDPEGVLHAGESRLCTSLGHVADPLRVLDTKPCGKCGLSSPEV
jgi:hypothetical protein